MAVKVRPAVIFSGGAFYRHDSVKHSAREFVYGLAHTNGIESVWAVLKRGFRIEVV